MLWIRIKDQKQSIKQPINQSRKQSRNQSINRCINQGISLWMGVKSRVQRRHRSFEVRLDGWTWKSLANASAISKLYWLEVSKQIINSSDFGKKYSVFSFFIFSLEHKIKYFYCRKVLKVFLKRKENHWGVFSSKISLCSRGTWTELFTSFRSPTGVLFSFSSFALHPPFVSVAFAIWNSRANWVE